MLELIFMESFGIAGPVDKIIKSIICSLGNSCVCSLLDCFSGVFFEAPGLFKQNRGAKPFHFVGCKPMNDYTVCIYPFLGSIANLLVRVGCPPRSELVSLIIY
nr:hypothetical protein HMPREF0276_0977 [Corynebacterium accolens ATCC 49725]